MSLHPCPLHFGKPYFKKSTLLKILPGDFGKLTYELIGHFYCAEEQRLFYWSSTEAYTCLMALAHSAHAQLNRNLHIECNLAQRQHPQPHSQADPVHLLPLVAFLSGKSNVPRAHREQDRCWGLVDNIQRDLKSCYVTAFPTSF